ncbi:MAG: hypothetical protein A2939_05415 [Parcubacteria group bacterium RIFCSPLOWO2_01_FULL_48_18]|nr:MAG: hypothetical protein A3J67_06555 [Parcubacteria group bacterium RIFCSPHIGHO2_02_FULL_48_10b]OHB22536.1 MAG: hypothetical protein A2939_05415 [Parcubacteria group bacterium RIFCSPLOWO2_01_FULL_48_18]
MLKRKLRLPLFRNRLPGSRQKFDRFVRGRFLGVGAKASGLPYNRYAVMVGGRMRAAARNRLRRVLTETIRKEEVTGGGHDICVFVKSGAMSERRVEGSMREELRALLGRATR